MPTIPGAIQSNPKFRGFDRNGDPLPAGKLHTFLAGTSTPEAVFTDAALTTPHANPVILDANAEATIYLGAVNYKFRLDSTLDVPQWTVDNIQDIAELQFTQLGQTLATGQLGITAPYLVLSTDQLVTVNTAGGAIVVTLHTAATLRLPLTIKNLGVNVVTVRPQATETIDGVTGDYTIPIAASPQFPSIFMVPDGTSGWFILASHDIP